MTRSALYYVANSPKQQIAVKMSPHSDTLSWFRSPIISLNVQDYLIFDMLEVSITCSKSNVLIPTEFTFLASSQLNTITHRPWYCTVHAFVVIHFVKACILFDWKQICAGLFYRIYIAIGDPTRLRSNWPINIILPDPSNFWFW
jgi:hypothetical protein